MAYVTPTTIAVGDAVKKDDYDKIANNTIDHETRVTALEVGASVVTIFDENIHNLTQYSGISATLEGLMFFQAKQALSLDSAIISDLVGAASGTYEFDILKSSSVGGTYTTVFSTKPSVTPSGSALESSNAIFSTTAVAIGDWLRFDITQIAVDARSINISLTAAAA